MKTIIIDRSILHALGGRDAIFGRGNILVHAARTSEEILNLHGVHKADMIISDIALPIMGGVKLCSTIRNDDALKDVSIIMACAGVDESLSLSGKSGANAVIMKPVERSELFSRISELLVVPQRQNIRSLLNVSVNGREGNNSFHGVSSNISISGLLLETAQPLKKGDRMTCAITIGKREITVECVVMRVDKPAPGKFRCGVKFMNLDTKSFVIIEQFVKGAIKHSAG